MKFSDCLSQRVRDFFQIFYGEIFKIIISFQVDMSKIKLDVIKPWIQDKITEILKIDDDVVVDFVYNQLDEKVILYLKKNYFTVGLIFQQRSIF